ncbi:MAG: cytochrome C [Bacteroidota bacterium]
MTRIKVSEYLLKLRFLALVVILFPILSYSQLSPGDLAEAHSHLEGLSNCTECHTLGKKIGNDKCLVCHTFIKDRIDKKKGFHSSKEIAGENCISCHSDHNGKKFKMIRFDESKFNHSDAGYNLEGVHEKKECKDCHKKDFIVNKELKKRNKTFLGLDTDCISCHADYHQETLSSNCIECHDMDSFKPAPKFNHDKTKYTLVGKHKEVDCIKCHNKVNLNGMEYQMFSGIEFESCTSCHEDVHDNKFGQNCTKCHNEQSFNIILSMDSFNHDNTRFKLEAKHKYVDCKECHPTKLTDPIKHNNCTDCHTDYHEKQFVKLGVAPDCSDCHSTSGFVGSSYTIDRHSKTEFPLVGAHVATPCFVCHKTEAKWNFGNMGTKCADCHDDIHQAFISKKYYPEANCKNCHSENNWVEINFNHSDTDYELLGAHKNQNCRDCHFKLNTTGQDTQHFKDLSTDCVTCHNDNHNGQFEADGKTDCYICHDYNDWRAKKFDHNKARFILDGKHQNVTCAECHKDKIFGNKKYVVYKLNNFKCEDCH